MSIKLIFVGTRPIAARMLSYLHEEHADEVSIVGVVTLPVGSTGWWSSSGEPEVWEVALDAGIPLVEHDDIADHDYDVLFCSYWHRMFTSEQINKASIASVNYHSAPLPRLRGANSYAHAILLGERDYGVTYHLLVDALDEGPIVLAESFPILASDTAEDLYNRSCEMGMEVLARLVPQLVVGEISVESQEDIIERTGIESLMFKKSSLDPLMALERTDDDDDVERLVRALTFPPRFAPADWMLEAVSDSRAEVLEGATNG